MGLKQKTISGLFWSFIDRFAQQLIAFVVGIVLARLLSPQEFGLIGMLTIFIALSQSFVDSGFSQALIRKTDCTDTDYSTVFYFNLAVSILFYGLLFAFSGLISRFFDEPVLQPMLKVMGVVVILNAFTKIQRTLLIKRIDFKLQTRISVIASIAAGTIGIILAYKGFGVWSLVTKTIAVGLFTSIMLWAWNKWTPIMAFSKRSFRELFGFGSKLLASGLLDTAHRNIYHLVIGRFFSAADLGFYTRANDFKKLPSQTLNSIINRVTYPVLSSMQDNNQRLKTNYRKIIKATMLLTFVMMLGLAAVAEPLIITLIGEQWRPSISLLQLLCFVGMMHPLHAINLNMLKVKGRSDLFLKLEIIKKVTSIPIIILGIFYGIHIMIAAMILKGQFSYFLNSYYSGKQIGYPHKAQIKDVLPSFMIALATGASVFLLGLILPFSSLPNLIIQTTTGAILALVLCEITRIDAYVFIKEIAYDKLNEFKNARK